jgi:Ser/Thr protein kinase RdoA (MazF antagonist)
MFIPLEVRRAYGLAEDEAALGIEHVPSNINRTYIVRRGGASARPELVLQRMHPVFGANVHVDIAAVTLHLAARNVETPRLIPTQEGELWTLEQRPAGQAAHVWRALSFIDGLTFHQSLAPDSLGSAAQLLGTFHAALVDLEHEFVHERPLHDTARHLSNLRAALAAEAAHADAQVQALGAQILRQAEQIRLDFSELPRRVVHGDPKLSNIMFHLGLPPRARCMLDLDTLGRGYLAYELGDALRSWCNPAGEDTRAAGVELGAFRAVIEGYSRACPADNHPEEILSGIDGLETVSLELASRFATDVVWDRYFGWDETRFGSRREHNLLRAEGQLALSRNVREQRGELVRIAKLALARPALRPANPSGG